MPFIVGMLFVTFVLVLFFVRRAMPRKASGDVKTEEPTKNALPKEVEIAWEASDLMELPRIEGGESLPRLKQEWFHGQDLPTSYSEDRLVLMARDPNWIYAYWEVTHERYQKVLKERAKRLGLSSPVLRLYDITQELVGDRQQDYYLNDQAKDWYVHMPRPRHTFVAEYGRIFPDRFVPILRSNAVTLPPAHAGEWVQEGEHALWGTLYGKYLRDVGISSFQIWGNDSK